MPLDAHSFWVVEPGTGRIRRSTVPEPAADEVLVRTRYSVVSRGTESIVFAGGVPESERDRMRAPHQEGDFPGPVKYGYLNVGLVEQGSPQLRGRTVFCLYPHQTRYVVPAAEVAVVPDGVPAARAALAGILETAINLAWDARPWIGQRITVVGAGLVGACVGRLLAGVPGTDVTLVDVDRTRAELADALGLGFALPTAALPDRDLVVHTSATAAGLQLSIDLLGPEGTVWDLSWYGDREVSLALGGSFHAGRLSIRSSQVGTIPAGQRARRTSPDRLALALQLLRDPAYDALLTDRSPFSALPEVLAGIVAGHRPGAGHLIDYDDEPPTGTEERHVHPDPS